ncbi:hypothetical protein PAPHI01_0294 [Pancytospora philotis]|nr:hypothetical protein PAPHI01_0294 [Pancytospora philotis]
MNLANTACEIAGGALFIASLGRFLSSFTVAEVILLTQCFVLAGSRMLYRPLSQASCYAFAFSDAPHALQCLAIPFIFDYKPSAVAAELAGLRSGASALLLRIVASTTLCAALQAFSYLYLDINTRRKIFHFAAFLLFSTPDRPLVLLGQHALYVFVYLVQTALPEKLFRGFLSDRDFGGGIFSHIFLLAAVLYTSGCLESTGYTKALITLCIMDSFASIAGTCAGAKGKSIQGLLGGQAAAYMAEYAQLGTVDWAYHLTMGILEYSLTVNDNIALPVASVVYFNYVKPAAAPTAMLQP